MTDRVLLTTGVLLTVVLLWLLMLKGWRGRVRRQGDLPPPPVPPEVRGDVVVPATPGLFVGTTFADDWLDRVAVHGLGVRSAAGVSVLPDGVLVARRGAPDVWVPRPDLLGVRRQRGIAGKFVEADGLVVLTWRLGGQAVDTGLRVRRAAERGGLEEAVRSILTGQGTGRGDLEVRRG